MAANTIVFFPEGAFGPTNNCVGIGEVLRDRGHRVVFVIEESFAGTLEEKGFEERLMRLGAPPEQEEEPGQFWKDFIRDTAPVFRKSTFEQLGEFIAPTWQALLDGARYVDERLVEIFDELQPDAIVEDNVCSFPAILASGRPWVRIVSAAGWRDDPRLGLAQPLSLPARGRLPAVFAARPDLAQPRIERPQHRRRVEATDGAGRPRWSADLPQPRLARLGRRPIDEEAGRGPGADAPPIHRLEGASAQRVRARGQHGRRGVPPAGVRAASGRSGDHPWRQQHDDRVASLRQADDPAAGLLGPARQRAADRRDGLRDPPADLL